MTADVVPEFSLVATFFVGASPSVEVVEFGNPYVESIVAFDRFDLLEFRLNRANLLRFSAPIVDLIEEGFVGDVDHRAFEEPFFFQMAAKVGQRGFKPDRVVERDVFLLRFVVEVRLSEDNFIIFSVYVPDRG